MKKLLIALTVLIMMLAVFAIPVFAAETICGDGCTLMMPLPDPNEPDLQASGRYTVTTSGELKTGNDVTFSVTDDSGEPIKTFSLAIKYPWSKPGYVDTLYHGRNVSDIQYNMKMPGTYYLYVNGSYSGSYTVTGEDLLASRVRDIVSGCRAGSEYETALRLHDWLTLNTYYDALQDYHGPDYLLFEGYGVCQSYSNAYLMLLEEAGIQAEYISSESLNHAWNAVKIDGNWYHADVTWDTSGKAPHGEGTPSSSNYHVYFLVSDKVFRNMIEPHYGHAEKYADMCVSMEANYYVRSGLAEQWISESIEKQLNLKLEGKSVTSSITIDWLQEEGETVGNTTYFQWIPGILRAAAVAEVYNGQERIGTNGKTYVLSASSEGDLLTVTAKLVTDDWHEMDILELPKNVLHVGAEAFINTAAEVIVIPENCEDIAADAFEDCGNLKYIVNRSALVITAPEGVELIDETKE